MNFYQVDYVLVFGAGLSEARKRFVVASTDVLATAAVVSSEPSGVVQNGSVQTLQTNVLVGS